MRVSHYFLYHNPKTMKTEFREIADSGCKATNKEFTAEKAAEENAIIWCVGRKQIGKENRYFLYQRIIDTKCVYSKQVDIEQGAFKVELHGKTTFSKGYEWNITDEDFFKEIIETKTITMGLQVMGSKLEKTLKAFKAAFERSKQ